MNNSSISQSDLVLTSFRQKGWYGWIAESWQDFAGFADLEAWLSDPSATLILDTHCRRITRHGTPRAVLYSKLMRAQNDGVLLKRELFSMFKWRFYPSRAICILRTTAQMLALGHHCPLPVLGLRRKAGLRLPQDLYVATEIPDPTVEERLLNSRDLTEQEAILGICGCQLAKFHRDGFVHGDFLPRNTCLDASNTRFSYLDNDRTRRWPQTPIFHFKRRNLTQFCYNLHVLQLPARDTLQNAFLQAYAQEAGWNKKRLQAEDNLITAQNARRWDHAIAGRKRQD